MYNKKIPGKIMGNILGTKKRKDIKSDHEHNEWVDKMKERGYTVYQQGRCPQCKEGYATVMHHSGVVHGRCNTCNWSSTGFGGPNVHSWGEAVRRTHGAKGAAFVEQEKRAGRY